MRSLLPHHSSGHSPAPTTTTDSEEEDSLTPFLRENIPEDSDSQGPSPSHGRYYLHVPLTSLRPPLASRSTFSPISRKSMTSSLTSVDRGLPPLPSRRDKFRIYSPQTTRGRRSQHLHHYAYSRPSGTLSRDCGPPGYDRNKVINRFSHIYQNA